MVQESTLERVSWLLGLGGLGAGFFTVRNHIAIAAALFAVAAVCWVLAMAVRAYSHREVPVYSDSGVSVSAAIWRGRWAILAGVGGLSAVGAYVNPILPGMAAGAVAGLMVSMLVLTVVMVVYPGRGPTPPADAGVGVSVVVTFLAAPHLPVWATVCLAVGIIAAWPKASSWIRARYQALRR